VSSGEAKFGPDFSLRAFHDPCSTGIGHAAVLRELIEDWIANPHRAGCRRWHA
jgi:hypothetical protein